MIFPGSRYSQTYTFTTASGATLTLLEQPLPGPAVVRGYYRRGGSQRLDQIANAFQKDATAFWELCDANNSVVPDALAARSLIGIPPGRS